MKNRIIYNNYQYYENVAFKAFLEKQMDEGYHLYSMIVGAFSLLKFKYLPEKTKKSYAIYHKHLDEQIDAEIANMKSKKTELICENNQYIIFAIPSTQYIETKTQTKNAIKKQNILLGLSKKKAIVFICILFLLSTIGFVSKILLINEGNLYLNQYKLSLCLALIIIFLVYFIGDLHDIMKGKGICIDGIIHISNRSKFKDILFQIGDFLRVGVFLASIFISLAMINNLKNEILTFNIIAFWFIYFLVRYLSWLRFRHSYISLLVTEVFLIVISLV